jgi:DNA-binding NarL/FixJ family response regulator
MPSTRLLLADDHQILRQGLRALLSNETDLELVGEVGDGLEAVEQTAKLKPDVLLLDLMMPHLNGLEVTRQLAHLAPETHIIILSMHAEEAYVLEALRCGAQGYVLKDAGSTELLHAIREVVAGRTYLSSPLSERAIAYYVEKAKEEEPLDPYETLTTREREVLHMAAEGQNSAEIATRLFISPRTAETHRANLLHKLGLHSQTDIVRYALQRGIIK